MLRGLFLALGQLGDPVFRRVLGLSLAISLALVVVLGWAGSWAIDAIPPTGNEWVDRPVRFLAGLGLVGGLLLLFMPVSSAVIGIFLDDIAEAVERRHYPADPPGRALGFTPALAYGVQFALLVLAVNVIAAPFYVFSLFVAGLGLLLYYAINGYLLGREYFELAALRQVGSDDARRLRRRFRGQVFMVGAITAFAFTIPFANLLAPLIATAWMVHVFKSLKKDSHAVT
jgi:uncharacterized protein involved in cysteine biosynthesis